MNKSFIFLFVAVALALMAIPFSSATLTLSPTSLTYDIDPGNNAYKTFSILYESPLPVQFNGNLTWDNPNSDITLTSNQTTFTINPNERIMFKITVDVDSSASHGTYHTNIYVYNTDSGIKEKTLPVTINVGNVAAGDYCKYSEQGDYLTITIDKPSSGDDFYAGNNMTIKTDIENTDNSDLDVVVKAQLYDLTDDDKVEETSYKTTIKGDDSKTVTMYLTVPSSINPDHDYAVRAKVYEDGNEDGQCKEDSVDVTLNKKEHSLVIDSYYVSPSTVGCTDTYSLYLKVSNTGSNDEDVKIKIINSELGINYIKTLTINQDDSYSASFSFTAPSNATEKTYSIPITVYYNNEESSVSGTTNLEIKGKCTPAQPPAYYDVAMSLQQLTDAFPGKEFVVKASLTNIGNAATTYSINASEYGTWATVARIEPTTMVLVEGNSGDVYITLVPNENAAGSYSFKVRVGFNNTVKEQLVTVQVKKESTPATWLEQLVFDFNRNWQWIITDAILAIVIVTLIVLLINRSARNKRFLYEQPTEIKLRTFDEKESKRKK